jgi:hypothetical protein
MPFPAPVYQPGSSYLGHSSAGEIVITYTFLSHSANQRMEILKTQRVNTVISATDRPSYLGHHKGRNRDYIVSESFCANQRMKF